MLLKNQTGGLSKCRDFAATDLLSNWLSFGNLWTGKWHLQFFLKRHEYDIDKQLVDDSYRTC